MKALFLDRDGTINIDYGYVHEPDRFVFIDGVFDFCRKARERGFSIVVVTNQSGIARGYYTERDFALVTGRMVASFAAEGVEILDVFHCPSLDGPDRKPEPGLFFKARDKYGIDMPSSVNVGDRERDLEAGRRAGVGKNLLFKGDFAKLAEELWQDTKGQSI